MLCGGIFDDEGWKEVNGLCWGEVNQEIKDGETFFQLRPTSTYGNRLLVKEYWKRWQGFQSFDWFVDGLTCWLLDPMPSILLAYDDNNLLAIARLRFLSFFLLV